MSTTTVRFDLETDDVPRLGATVGVKQIVVGMAYDTVKAVGFEIVKPGSEDHR